MCLVQTWVGMENDYLAILASQKSAVYKSLAKSCLTVSLETTGKLVNLLASKPDLRTCCTAASIVDRVSCGAVLAQCTKLWKVGQGPHLTQQKELLQSTRHTIGAAHHSMQRITACSTLQRNVQAAPLMELSLY